MEGADDVPGPLTSVKGAGDVPGPLRRALIVGGEGVDRRAAAGESNDVNEGGREALPAVTTLEVRGVAAV